MYIHLTFLLFLKRRLLVAVGRLAYFSREAKCYQVRKLLYLGNPAPKEKHLKMRGSQEFSLSFVCHLILDVTPKK
jgi:hypothetical protein